MKMVQTEFSETSAYKIQTPGNYPEENMQQNLTFVFEIETKTFYRSGLESVKPSAGRLKGALSSGVTQALVRRCSLLDYPLSFKYFSFAPSSPRHDSFEAVRGLDVWKFSLAFSLFNLWFILVKKLANFVYVVVVFLSLKFKFISENFKSISQRK
jgi:hypothetical protein